MYTEQITKKIEIRNPFLINPFFAYCVFWLASIFGYMLSPSKLNIPLNAGLLAFLLLTVGISCVLACRFNRKFKNKFFHLRYRKTSKILLLTFVLCYGLEFIHARNIPMLSALFGLGDPNYKDFGVPTLHVVIVTFSIFYCLYHFFIFCHYKKIDNLWGVLLPCAYFVLVFSRGMLVFIAVVAVILFLLNKKLQLKLVLGLAVLGVLGAWIFGVLGNIRSGYAWNDSYHIMNVAQIKGNRFSIFAPFYWVEEYFVCSLRNLNYNVVQLSPDWSLNEMAYCLIPDFIAKRLFPDIVFSEKTLRATYGLTTGTTFVNSYVAFGFLGLVINFVYYVLIAKFFEHVKGLASAFRILSFSILFYLYAMTIFDNMLVYSGYSFVFAFVAVWAYWEYRERLRDRHRRLIEKYTTRRYNALLR